MVINAGQELYAQQTVMSHQRNKEVKASTSIFPNPVIDVFNVSTEENIGYIRVYNILGREVTAFDAREVSSFEVTHLKRGIYIVRIFDPQDQLIKALRMSKA